MEVDCLVRCCVYLPINHSETDRDTESSHKRETENSNNEAEQPSQRGCWEKKRKMGKMDLLCVPECWEIESRSIWPFHLCSERIISPQHPRGISQTAILQVRNPLRADKQDYEAPNPGKKLPAVQNHIQRMKMDCNTLKFISPGQERTCPLLFIGQAFYISSRNEYVLHHII